MSHTYCMVHMGCSWFLAIIAQLHRMLNVIFHRRAEGERVTVAMA